MGLVLKAYLTAPSSTPVAGLEGLFPSVSKLADEVARTMRFLTKCFEAVRILRARNHVGIALATQFEKAEAFLAVRKAELESAPAAAR
jgi:hypothetical protein